jgi:hypothetical protein
MLPRSRVNWACSNSRRGSCRCEHASTNTRARSRGFPRRIPIEQRALPLKPLTENRWCVRATMSYQLSDMIVTPETGTEGSSLKP